MDNDDIINILLIEDNTADARMLQELLDIDYPGTFKFVFASTLREGLDRIESDATIDVVITDFQLPDSMGVDTINRMLDSNNDFPLIVLSGNDNQKLAMEAVKSGAQDYLIKSEGDGKLIGRAIYYALERKKLQLELQSLAMFDSLTGLPNRYHFYALFDKALKRARRYDYLTALVFIDVDRFKEVNDEYGHQAGDRLLKIIAGRLRQCCREADWASRLAGDEFTVVLENVADVPSVERVAERILTIVNEPCNLGDDEAPESIRVEPVLSLGIALYPVDTESSENLVKLADAAMYTAKNAGGNHFVLYSGNVAPS